MHAFIKQIRKSLTTIELEAGERHPNKPNYRAMQREVEEIQFQAKKLAADIRDLADF